MQLQTTQRSSSASGFRSRSTQFGAGGISKAPSRPNSAAFQKTRTSQIESALSDPKVVNLANVIANSSISSSLAKSPKGLSIRGAAGPFVVQASNLQSGTTAADIQNVLIDIAGPGNCKSCRIVTNRPTVIAEMVFAEKRSAEQVISALNNQIADGRTLHCFMKTMGGTSEHTVPSSSRPQQQTPADEATPTNGPVVDLPSSNNGDVDMAENVDIGAPPYSAPPAPTGNDRPDLFSRKEDRGAEPDIQDGRFGFEARQEREFYKAQHRQAQEETEQAARDSENRKSSTRYDDRDRNQDRDREYGKGNFARRGDDSYRRADDRYARSGYQRDGRRTHYGNGASGGREYDSRDGYGHMYSDSMMPPRRGGARRYG